MGDEREGGFKVTDRRRFASEAGAPDADETAERPPAGPRPAAGGTVTFASVVVGLSTQALMHLGEVAEPDTPAAAPDLGAAQDLIEILAVLKTKTEGNLTTEESGLLDAVLYDLRMRYVAIARPRKETP